jgi:NAD-dependent dihydropyrimidine dehydrogenase PreA subunit
MVMLDDRARRAAQAIQESVAEYTPAAPFPVVVRRRRWLQLAQGALAFAAVVGFIVLGAFLRPAPEDEVADDPPVIDETPEVVDVVPGPEVTIPDVAPDLETPFDPTDPGPDDAPEAQPPPGTAPTDPAPPVEEPVDTTAPPISITSPSDGARFDVTTISFEGTTEPGAKVAAGRWQADVDGSGNWVLTLVLSEGANRATFTATDPAGNTSTASVVVHYHPPPPPPPKDEGDDKPVDWEFSARQVYGSCAETPPYDVFYGTAQPGTVVTVTSEYGSAATEVTAKGEWEVKVFFEGAPRGKVFAVKVKDVQGNKKIFEFVHTEV